MSGSFALRVGLAASVVGLACLVVAGWLLVGTGWVARGEQQALREQFAAALSDPSPDAAEPAAPPTGAFGVLSSSALGDDFDWVVGYGVGPDELRRGPGYYIGTGVPGHLGNVVVAGHRTTYGAPFSRLDELVDGDELRLQTVAGTFQYRVVRVFVVAASDTGVLEPNPQDVSAPAERRLLTLTTCHPRFSARQRLIVVAEQTDGPVLATTPA